MRARLSGAVRRGLRLAGWAALGAAMALLLWIASYRWVDPPGTPYIWSEAARLGGVERQWRGMDEIAPVMARAAVAAEDANFCLHWGFDVVAIRAAIEAGANRGASTISQQVVKNAFLWQGRSWPRKALEAAATPAMEALWPKRRVLEVYLNVAEFGEGVFGVEAAARHHFGVSADALSAAQAAALAAVLPSPKTRDPAALSPDLRRRAAQIRDGAATIARDGRAACFED
jgi:monofunctional biosynthetic peptidoglycan transglycosylase